MRREIPLDADRVWRVLGEGFGDLSWSSDIDSSSLRGGLEPGAIRTCRFAPNMFSKTGEVNEVLLGFDRGARSLSYEAQDLPGFMPRAINRWSVESLGPGRCRVVSHATCQLRGVARIFTPWVRRMLRRMGHRFIDELAAAAARPSAEPKPAAAGHR